jgi:hypothetical protein
MEPIHILLVRKTINLYVCSNCWGDLVEVVDPTNTQRSFVLCERCGEDTKGYVTRYYADRRREDSMQEKFVVEKLLQNIGVLNVEVPAPLPPIPTDFFTQSYMRRFERHLVKK